MKLKSLTINYHADFINIKFGLFFREGGGRLIPNSIKVLKFLITHQACRGVQFTELGTDKWTENRSKF